MRGGPRRTSRVGLVPPAGMVVSKSFGGFEDVAKDSAILIAAQPPAAYPEIEKGLAADVLKKNGITVDNREEMKFDFGKGTLVIGKQTADKTRYRKWLLNVQTKELTALVNVHIPEQETAYPDAVLRAALATLAVRATIPDAEKLSLLPFTLSDLAGFHVENVLPGRAECWSIRPTACRPTTSTSACLLPPLTAAPARRTTAANLPA